MGRGVIHPRYPTLPYPPPPPLAAPLPNPSLTCFALLAGRAPPNARSRRLASPPPAAARAPPSSCGRLVAPAMTPAAPRPPRRSSRPLGGSLTCALGHPRRASSIACPGSARRDRRARAHPVSCTRRGAASTESERSRVDADKGRRGHNQVDVTKTRSPRGVTTTAARGVWYAGGARRAHDHGASTAFVSPAWSARTQGERLRGDGGADGQNGQKEPEFRASRRKNRPR